VQPPTAPPYARALAARRAAGGALGKTGKTGKTATTATAADEVDTSFADLLASLPPLSKEKLTGPSTRTNAPAKDDLKESELDGLPLPIQAQSQSTAIGVEDDHSTSLANLEQRIIARLQNGKGQQPVSGTTG
jgi:hypothetical protein